MNKLRSFFSCFLAGAAVLLCILLLLPSLYGGANPFDRFSRMNDGGNFAQTLSDSAAVAYICKSGIFDINMNGQEGVFIYRTGEEKNSIEVYWQLGEGNNRTASYILIKDGVRYQFSMLEDSWQFDGNRVCLTDLTRLTENMALILTDHEAASADDLKTDLNGLVGFDLSNYINFNMLPSVIRSLADAFEDESFLTAAGYTFNLRKFTLQYQFSPTDYRDLFNEISSLAEPAYTKKLQTMIHVAGIADGIADLIGFDIFDSLLDANLTVSCGAFSGKLIKFTFASDTTTLSVVNRKYGNAQINIESEQLKALISTHIA